MERQYQDHPYGRITTALQLRSYYFQCYEEPSLHDWLGIPSLAIVGTRRRSMAVKLAQRVRLQEEDSRQVVILLEQDTCRTKLDFQAQLMGRLSVSTL
jgi:hypothetical protein